MKEYQKPEVKVVSLTQTNPIAFSFGNELSIPHDFGDFWD